MQLGMFLGKNLISVEKEMRRDTNDSDANDLGPDSLLKSQVDEIIPWMKEKLSGKVANVKVYKCIIFFAIVILENSENFMEASLSGCF